MEEKKRKLTIQQEKFLDVLISDAKGDFEVAKRLAGYSENTTVREITSSLREEIVRVTFDALTMHGPKAAAKMTGLLDDPINPGATTILKTASEILNRVGVVHNTGSINMKVPKGGLVIMPAKEAVEVSVESTDEED